MDIENPGLGQSERHITHVIFITPFDIAIITTLHIRVEMIKRIAQYPDIANEFQKGSLVCFSKSPVKTSFYITAACLEAGACAIPGTQKIKYLFLVKLLLIEEEVILVWSRSNVMLTIRIKYDLYYLSDL